MNMKSLITAVILIAGIFTANLILAQSENTLVDKQIAKTDLEKPKLNKEMSFLRVQEILVCLSTENSNDVPIRAVSGSNSDLFDNGVNVLNKLLSDNKLSYEMLKMIIAEIKTEYNFYDKLISKGYDASSALAVKSKQACEDQKPASTEYENFRLEYTEWQINNAPIK